MEGLSSGLASPITSLVAQKRTLGYPYRQSAAHLKAFDQMCADRFPGEKALTREMTQEWTRLRPGEHPNGLMRRVTPVRQLGKHMAALGMRAHLIPPGVPGGRSRYVPRVFTKPELRAFFSAVDRCPQPFGGIGWRDMVAPALFRVMYCLALRPSEARNLAASDVDAAAGRLLVRESKGHKDRIVHMSEDLSAHCRGYDQQMSKLCPNRSVYFPNPSGERYSSATIDTWFHEFWDPACGGAPRVGPSARPYDLRHTAVVNLIGSWLRAGEDVNAMIPYLAAHLGHANYDDTYYYFHLVPEQFGLFRQIADAARGPRYPQAVDHA